MFLPLRPTPCLMRKEINENEKAWKRPIIYINVRFFFFIFTATGQNRRALKILFKLPSSIK